MLNKQLLPRCWPYWSDNNTCIKSRLSKKEAKKIISKLEEGTIDRCLKIEKEEEPKEYKGYKSREEWLQDRLYLTMGSITDVPKMNKLPIEIQQHLRQYEDVFCSKLPRGRSMKVEPVDIQIDPSIPKPPKCVRPRPVPAHWVKQSREIMDNLLEAGLIEPIDISEGYIIQAST